MDFDQIISFLTVATEGHFGRAARRLGISKQVLSHRIIALEKHIKHPLFDRSNKGVQTTLIGKAFLRHAETLHSTYENAQKELQHVAHAQAGTLRIGSGASSNHLIIPDLVRSIRDERLPVVISIHSRMPSEMLAMLHQLELDFAICTPPPTAIADSEFQAELLFTSGDRIIHSDSHPLAQKKRLSLADLVGYPWIMYPHFPTYYDKIVAAFEKAKLPVPQEVLYADDPLLTRSLLSVAPYLAVWPTSALLVEIESRVLIARDLPELRLERPCYLFSHAKIPPSAALKFCVTKIRALSRKAQQEINKVVKGGDAWTMRHGKF